MEALVENQRQSDTTFTARLYVDDEEVDSRRVTVPVEETIEVGFTRQFDDPGTYDIRVNDEAAGALRVQEPIPTPTVTATPPATPTPSPTPTPAGPPDEGLRRMIILVVTVLAAVLILAGGAYLYFQEYRGQ